MSKNNLAIGDCPCDENTGLDLDDPDYRRKARIQCNAYISQLKRMHGEPPEGVRYVITWNPHDFGTYADVEIIFDDEKEDANAYAWKVEADLPGEWDEQAKLELEKASQDYEDKKAQLEAEG